MKQSLTIKIIQESDSTYAPFAAYVPKLDVSSCGKTK